MDLTRDWVAGVTGGRRTGPDPAVEPVGHAVAFDSRRLQPGEVFVAIRGERDGHDFVADALARGAAFVVVERAAPEGPAVVVPDAAVALRAMAHAGRRRIDGRVVAITGSVGKTSTKDLTAAVLGAGLRTHAAPESFNNEIGVPVTVLGAPEDTEALVVEMGARFAGNIADLCAIALPEIGIITNIGITHAEHLGGPEGVARVKGELLDALPTHGLAVVSASCEGTAGQRHRSAAPVLTVGTEPAAHVRVSDVHLDGALHARFLLETPWGAGEVRLGVRGEHQVVNAAQAATVALHLGVPFASVVAALASAVGSSSRMELIDTAWGVRVLDDAYNASPVATVAALDALAALDVPGRRVAVLGDMRELGALSREEHARVGTAAAASGVDLVIAVGEETGPLADAARAGGCAVASVTDAESGAICALELVEPGDVVLVKGSRAVGLEVVVDALVGAEALA